MPDASPAGGRPAAPDQPTTDLNRLWARPVSSGPGPGAARHGSEPKLERKAEAPSQDPARHGSEPKLERPAEAAGQDPAAGGEQEATAATAPTGDRAGFRLAAFGALLVVVLFAGYGLGRLNNGGTPEAPPTTTGAMPGMAVDENQPHTHGAATQGTATSMGAAVGGLSLSESGLTLVPTRTIYEAGTPQRLSFRITGPGGAPITSYAVVHDKLLHLVVVRRDLTGYQHLHPSMTADGTWGIDLTLAQPGIYRMIADFTALVGGKPVATTLGTDLTVAGDYLPARLPAPVPAVAVDGLSVGYEGTPSIQSTQPIMMSVAGPDHRPAVLEPYLGAYGHLVVLRQGDLAYVHVHPEAALVDGKVKFWLSAPSNGTYRMFFDFQVAGQVHTAAWTMIV